MKGQLLIIEMKVIYDKPEPVLYRKDVDAKHLDGIHFCFGDKAFMSDESEDYGLYILETNCDNDYWILISSDNMAFLLLSVECILK